MAEQWKSPRKVEQEVREYKHRRFEDGIKITVLWFETHIKFEKK